MMNSQRCIVMSLCLCFCATVVAGGPGELTITAAPGELIAARDNGLIILDDGAVIDKSGRLVARVHGLLDGDNGKGGDGGRDGDTPPNDTCPHWSDIAELNSTAGPWIHIEDIIFDSQGNAWVFYVENNNDVIVRHSTGPDGAWSDPVTISNGYLSPVHAKAAIDPDDNIMVVIRTSDFILTWTLYEPGVGWSDEPRNLVNHPQSIHYYGIAAGGDGEWLALFELAASSRLFSMRYDSDAGDWDWDTLQEIASPSYYVGMDQNEPGGALYVAYMSFYEGGMYANRYNWADDTWDPPEFLPGSESVGVLLGTWDSSFPITVDSNGEATVLWQTAVPGPYGVYASRTEGGVWQPAHELLEPGPFWADIVDFADLTSSENGDVFGAFTRYEDGIINLYAFRYRAGVGWDPTYNPYTYSCPLTTRTRIAAYRGGNAVATFLAPQDGVQQLTSLLYDGTDWSSELLDVPQEYPAFFQEMEANGGELLLVFDPEELIGDAFGIWATWLRDLAGDLDGDCDVDLGDLAVLLGSYGDGAGGDIDGDSDTDLEDLAALLGNYGEELP